MPWVRIDDHFDEHPKLAQVGPLGVALWTAGLAYANRNGTRGYVPWAVARGLVQWQFLGPPDGEGRRKVYRVTLGGGIGGEDLSADFVIDLLLEAGLWAEVDGGYAIHDYADYQPTPETVEARRAVRAAAGRLGGLAKQANRLAAASDSPSNALANAQQKSAPYPVPVPVPVPVPGGLAEEITPETPAVVVVMAAPNGATTTTTRPVRSGVTPRQCSDDARLVLERWRQAFGKRAPPKLNPTQAAQLEEAVVDLGVERLLEAVQWCACQGIDEFPKTLRAAATKREQDADRASAAQRHGPVSRQAFTSEELHRQMQEVFGS